MRSLHRLTNSAGSGTGSAGSGSNPVINTYSPAQGAIDVSGSQSIVLTFDQPVQYNSHSSSSQNFQLQGQTTGKTIDIPAYDTTHVTFNNNDVTIHPTTTLDADT